ncbi:hypothetical protein Tco_1476411 [Tanacetum coccineum]
MKVQIKICAEDKVDTGKAMDASLVHTESIGLNPKSRIHSSRSGNVAQLQMMQTISVSILLSYSQCRMEFLPCVIIQKSTAVGDCERLLYEIELCQLERKIDGAIQYESKLVPGNDIVESIRKDSTTLITFIVDVCFETFW